MVHNRMMIAQGRDAQGAHYELFDYGESGYSPATVNGLPNARSYRYWCFSNGRVFACDNERERIVSLAKRATEDSRYYDAKGSFTAM